jgi:hypothetical protein
MGETPARLSSAPRHESLRAETTSNPSQKNTVGFAPKQSLRIVNQRRCPLHGLSRPKRLRIDFYTDRFGKRYL